MFTKYCPIYKTDFYSFLCSFQLASVSSYVPTRYCTLNSYTVIKLCFGSYSYHIQRGSSFLIACATILCGGPDFEDIWVKISDFLPYSYGYRLKKKSKIKKKLLMPGSDFAIQMTAIQCLNECFFVLKQ